MDGGKFEITDVPGMMPSQEEIRREAERMAREMYPQRFTSSHKIEHNFPMLEGKAMISPEDFDKQMEKVQQEAMPKSLMGFPVELAPGLNDNPDSVWHAVPLEPLDQSPIARLFAAVRDILSQIKRAEQEFPGKPPFIHSGELQSAYDALGIDD